MSAKVMCIGLDACDRDLILEWAAAGRLPTFRSLLQRGAWGPIDNPAGVFVGAVWPCFIHAASPGRHGRYSFEQLRAGSYEVRRVHPHDFDDQPFWSTLSRAGRRLAVIDVPFTVPLHGLNGIQLCNWAGHDIDIDEHFMTWPVELEQKVRSRFGDYSLVSCDTCAARSGVAQLSHDLDHRIGVRTELLEHFLDQEEWDLFLAVFGESHCAGHHFWHLYDPGHPRHAEGNGRYADLLWRAYAALDRAVGRLLQRVDASTNVIVMASHGMGPHYDATFLLDKILLRFEGLPPPPPRRAKALHEAMMWSWQRMPPPLRRLLQPLRDRLVRRLYLGPRTLDARRKCFQIPNNDNSGGIRINLAGREPAGMVQPGAEYDDLCRELEQCLSAFTYADTGEPLVRRVLRSAELYSGPRLDYLPDLLVEWTHAAPVAAACSPTLGRFEGVPRSPRTGDHRPTGLWLGTGPAFPPGYRAQLAGMMDFGPTIASLLGVPLDGVEGRSLVSSL